MSNATPYFETVVNHLRSSQLIQGLGIVPEEIHWHRKGADHADLMQIAKDAWILHTTEDGGAGYKGVWVHFESRRPGDLRIDCELFPRQGSASKHYGPALVPLLDLKAGITQLLRDQSTQYALSEFGAHTKRARDPHLPSSLMVLAFDLGLPEDHLPDEFVELIAPIIERASPMIDSVCMDSVV